MQISGGEVCPHSLTSSLISLIDETGNFSYRAGNRLSLSREWGGKWSPLFLELRAIVPDSLIAPSDQAAISSASRPPRGFSKTLKRATSNSHTRLAFLGPHTKQSEQRTSATSTPHTCATGHGPPLCNAMRHGTLLALWRSCQTCGVGTNSAALRKARATS